MLLSSCEFLGQTLELHDDKVLIICGKKTTTIALDAITSITFNPGSFWTGGGHLTFNASGLRKHDLSPTAKALWGITGRIVDAGDILVPYKQNDEAKEFCRLVENAREAYKEKQSKQQDDPADMLLKYKALLDSGVITTEEFEQKKRQLLGT